MSVAHGMAAEEVNAHSRISPSKEKRLENLLEKIN